MKEYKLVVERDYIGKVKDTYSVYANNDEEAEKTVKDLIEDPMMLSMTPHITEEDKDDIKYGTPSFKVISDEVEIPIVL